MAEWENPLESLKKNLCSFQRFFQGLYNTVAIPNKSEKGHKDDGGS